MMKADITDQNYSQFSKEELYGFYQNKLADAKSLEWQLAELKRAIFGKKSERFVEPNPSQGILPGMEHLFKGSQDKPQEQQPVKGYTRPKRNNKPPLPSSDGRFPDSLPREDAGVIELSEEELSCPDCGADREVFKEEICERLVYKKNVSLVVKQYRKQVCKCPKCQDSIAKADSPKTPIKGVQLMSSVFAYILSLKYEFGLPFYRVEELLKQSGFGITRTTLSEYQLKIHELIKPLEAELMRCVKSGKYLHADESDWEAKVVNPTTKKLKYQKCVCWVIAGEKGTVFVKFGRNKRKESFHQLLGDYPGFVICDGEDHYDYFSIATGAKLGRCNAHSRRKFEKALKEDRAKATYILRIYGLIYKREAYIKYLKTGKDGVPPDKVIRLRQKSKRLLEQIRKVSLDIKKNCLPKTPIGNAAKYFVRYYEELVRFCDHSDLPIDNNHVERVIRKFVIGRKAWLFSSSEEGANSSALIYSLVLTCLNNSIPVIDYLDDVIHRIGVLGETNYQELLPIPWDNRRLQNLN